jgi:hypothetical protein
MFKKKTEIEVSSGTDPKSVEKFEYGGDDKAQTTRTVQAPQPKHPADSSTPRIKPAKPPGRSVKPQQTA